MNPLFDAAHKRQVLLLAVLLLAFGLRMYRLPYQSLWYDEALSVHYASQPLPEMLVGVSNSDHPPLHTLLLHLWMVSAGRSEFAVRYLSLWWGVLAVVLLYRLGARLVGRSAGLSAAGLLAISPLHVWYSQEARMYSLSLALSLGLVLSLLGVVSRRKNGGIVWWVYVLLGVGALYAHFYTAFVLLFVNLAFGFWWLRRLVDQGWPAMRVSLARWVAAQMAILVLFLPWGRFVTEQLATNATYWHGALGLGQILRETALAFAVGDRIPTTPLAQAGTLALIGLGLLGVGVVARSGPAPTPAGPDRAERTLWLILWLLVPVMAIFALSHDRPKFAPRYLLIALPALLLLAGAGWNGLASWIARREVFARWPAALGWLLASGLIISTTALALRAQYADPLLARPDFRAATRYISRHAGPGDTIVLLGGHSYPAFVYYFDRDLPVYPLPPGLLPSTRQPLDFRAVGQLAHITGRREQLWLLLWQDRLADPTGVVLDELLRSCPRLEVTQSFHQVALLLFSAAECTLFSETGPDSPVRIEFGEQLCLLGYDLAADTVAPGQTLQLSLYWRAMGAVNTNYTTFAQLIGPDGLVYAQHDMLTGDDAYPTSLWQPGAVIRNTHHLVLPADVPTGVFALTVGLYLNQGDLPRLPISYPPDGGSDALVLTEVQVNR
ncbi:MAG: glycosyltransferase family 39 protein [Chloroflexota bacterium]